MRPIRLEMSGFSAFREPTIVDFSDVDVLALVGPTGSGKSSIIDALTFALYGSVARYGEKDVAPIINQLSTEARVLLTFEVDGQRYTAVRIVRRTKTGATTREARLQRADEILAGDARALTGAVESLLGLTFERFNKTVVLPQGRFAEFLHDKPAQRQELLRELLGLGIYERIGQVARQRAKEAEGQADVLRRQLASGGDLSDQRLDELTLRLDGIRATRLHVARAADEAAELDVSRAAVTTELEVLSARSALVATVSVPTGIDELDRTIADARSRVSMTTAALTAARELRRRADEAADAGPSIAATEALLQRHRQRGELRRRLDAAEAELQQAAAAHDLALQVSMVVSNELQALRSAVGAARHLHQQAVAAIDQHPPRATLEAILLRYEQLQGLQAERHEAAATAAAATDQVAAARSTNDVAQSVVGNLQQLVPAAALALLLKAGDVCPVCEQPVHVLPARHDEADQELLRARESAQQARTELATAETRHASAAGSLAAIGKSIARLSAELSSAPSADDTARQLAAVDQLRATESTTRAAVAASEEALNSAESSARARTALDAERVSERRLTAASTTVDHLVRDLEAATGAVSGAPDEATATADLECARTLATARADASEAETVAEASSTWALAELATLQEREATARRSFMEARDRLASLGPPPTSDNLAADWSSLMGWRNGVGLALMRRTDELTAESRRLDTAADALLTSIRDLAGRYIDSGNHAIAAIRERLAAGEASALAARQRFDDERARAAGMQAALSAHEADGQVAGLLGDLLRSTKFERWLLDEAVTDLVSRATVRLHELTGGQYSLIAYEGGFRICDHRNADEVRDARSLSGGETFLASLALALALADSATDLAAEGTAPLESIFLDEGFGTLDPDTLDVVAGTIEELGASGRMVGIVTHIRELAERMPVRFEVSKGSTTSSVVRVDC